MRKLHVVLYALMLLPVLCYGQSHITGKIFDSETGEPIGGASVSMGSESVVSRVDGSFRLDTSVDTITISCAGYITKSSGVTNNMMMIPLLRDENNLQEIVVTANRDAVRRTQAPVSIATISSKLINTTKATTIDQLVNKIGGVYMVNLGNEQHAMGIRQPLGTRSLFLYLEDGIPVRTTGVFNHNALMEMNMAAVKSIEVIKGPGSSLYGGEAIGGVVNMITQSPPAIPLLKLSLQGNSIGYLRSDIQSGFTAGKWGVAVSGYYSQRKSGFIEFSDFRKTIFTARVDYRFNDRLKLENSLTYMDYYSDMSGSVDSAMFARKTFTSLQTFTYRKATTLRYRSTLIKEWNDKGKATVNFVYRDNSLGQNPAYRIRDDYRRSAGGWIGVKDLAHGEINDNSFQSFVFIAQHRQKFDWLQSVLVGGITVDISPNKAVANYIRIKKDTLVNKYTSYQDRKDSMLVNYKTGIRNYAGYLNIEFTPLKNLRVVSAIRYDRFGYDYNNYLPANSVSGSNDTTGSFSRLSTKVGLTYNFKNNRGLYLNYSEGFVPPQVSELYRGVKVPDLSPSTFVNYEAGGWVELIKGKLTADISVYRMEGQNTIISVKFDDGSFGNANAGKTLHRGIELGLQANPIHDIQIRIGGSYNRHEFKNYNERGVKYDGKEMNNAPHWIHNTEVTYQPTYLKGLRVAVEWQKMSEYFMDQANTITYKGFDVVNARIGFRRKNAEIWLNVINVFDVYYSVNSSYSNAGASYTPGEPRNFNLGLSYDLGSLLKSKK